MLLYSRLTGLTNAFTFHYTRSYSNSALSASDPYFLPLPKDVPDVLALRASGYGSHGGPRILAINLRAIKYESPRSSIISGLGKIYFENHVKFYQLSLLTNDLALSECLYAEVPNEFTGELWPPNTISRLEIAKTPARILDDFIVPNGYVDRDNEDSPHNLTVEKESDAESGASFAALGEVLCTISLEWLENEIYSRLTDASTKLAFHESLDFLRNEIEDKVSSGVPTMETLYVKHHAPKKASRTHFCLCRLRIANASVSVLDLDKASGDFVDFLDDMKRLNFEYENGQDSDEGRKLVVSSVLTPALQTDLGIRDTAELSSIYEKLLQTWILPLSRQVPARVRIALEKLLRDLAGQISLASHAMRIDSGTTGNEEKDQTESLETGAQFVLPVRRRASATSSGKGKERSYAVSSPAAGSLPMSEDAGFMPSSAVADLPTPEPTPSLRSGSSAASFAGSEDPASQRLRTYADLTPQPALPTKLSNLLGHWQVGMDPTDFDWEATQQATITQGESQKESQRRQRQRAETRGKRPRESTVGPSSQPTPKRLGGSQPQQGQHTRDTQGSSQQTEGVVAMSQIEPGKFGGHHAQQKKLKVKARPAGFK